MYKCQYPECNYQTENRHQINNHHIVPKELGGSNKMPNRIWLCPTHHSSIYIPNSQKGIHSKKTQSSIIILGWRKSSEGLILHWTDINNNENFTPIRI